MSNIIVDYKSWGLGENKLFVKLNLTNEQIEKAKEIAVAFLDLSNLFLKRAQLVYYFQKDNSPQKELMFLRFERKKEGPENLREEHVSFLVDFPEKKLVGLTQRLSSFSSENFIRHQQALQKAVNFLSEAASDLVPTKVALPLLPSKSVGARLDFQKPLVIGNLELHWIANHSEILKLKNKKVSIDGMKAKFYCPINQLWTWVIVGLKGDILTFERDVFWDFEKFRRKTQMWLHDDWLIAQNLREDG